MIIASDFDGTLTVGQMGKAVGEYLSAHGKSDLYRPFFRRQFPRYIRARLKLLDMRQFKTGWAVEMVKLFKGFTAEELHAMFAWVVNNELWPERRPKVLEELARHREEGHRVVVVSGAYQPMLELFCAKIGVEAYGTPLEMVDGYATGNLATPLNIGDHKVNTLRTILGDNHLDIAYGDSPDDLPMLKLAQTPIATHPDKKLRTLAQAFNWRILED